MQRIGKKFSKPSLSRLINGDIEVMTKSSSAPEKIRLDHLLVKKFPEYKRATLQKFIKLGFVTADEIVVTKSNLLIEPSTDIKLNLPVFAPATARPPVIYEDDFVLVLDKPAGLLSMKKGEFSTEATLEDFGFLVHRLDRDTSGVVILAKDPDTRAILQSQFQSRTAKKTYYAITVGTPKHPAARIDLPIARNLKRPTTFEVNPTGRPAITDYQVVRTTDGRGFAKLTPNPSEATSNAANSSPSCVAVATVMDEVLSLVRLQPITGRTHQLRVHLAYLNIPILGDPVYAKNSQKLHRNDPKLQLYHTSSEKSSKIADFRQNSHQNTSTPIMPRLFLHATSLEISIPTKSGTKLRKIFHSALPAEFQTLFPDFTPPEISTPKSSPPNQTTQDPHVL